MRSKKEKEVSMNKQLTEYKTSKGALEMTPQEVKNYLVSGKGKNTVTDAEVMHFIKMCFYQKLNPWLREAYLIKYDPKYTASMVVGKDVFLKRASHNPKFRGHKAEATENKDGKVTGAWAEVYIKDYQVPIRVVVDFDEYNQDNRMWNNKPKTMIRKVALAQALREAFPEDFEGLYSEEEMPTGDVELDRKPVKPTDADFEVQKDNPEAITPEQIDEIKKLALEIGYKKLNLATYRQHPEAYHEDMKIFREMKNLIIIVKDLHQGRVVEDGFLKEYGISNWNELHRVPPQRLEEMIDELRRLPLANEPEKVEVPKRTKAEKIQAIKDKIKELSYKENSPEVTAMLTPYGVFNVSQLVSLDGKTLDKILKEEFCER